MLVKSEAKTCISIPCIAIDFDIDLLKTAYYQQPLFLFSYHKAQLLFLIILYTLFPHKQDHGLIREFWTFVIFTNVPFISPWTYEIFPTETDWKRLKKENLAIFVSTDHMKQYY